MLPPVDDAVLQNNPEFATLYNTLTTAVLNANGTTKTDAAAKDREAVRQVWRSNQLLPIVYLMIIGLIRASTARKKLKSHRLKAARHHLVVQAISSAAVPRTDDGDSGSSSTRPATIAAHRRPNGNGSRRPTGDDDDDDDDQRPRRASVRAARPPRAAPAAPGLDPGGGLGGWPAAVEQPALLVAAGAAAAAVGARVRRPAGVGRGGGACREPHDEPVVPPPVRVGTAGARRLAVAGGRGR